MSDAHGPDSARETLRPHLADLYAPTGADVDELSDRFARLIADHRGRRARALEEVDGATPPDWYRSPEAVAYVLYADLFSPEAPAGAKLDALREQLGYFADLGVTVLHVLPILKSSGDGGFAVDDYERVDPRFGSNDALRRLIGEAHGRGIRIALDFVLNHVSDRHPWAVAAATGDPRYQPYFTWSDSGGPWPGVPDVFPEFAPGHWDYVPRIGRWVWATFYKRRPVGAERDRSDFAQWDLNYKNPGVLFGMLNYLLTLANWGVDLFRLDAIPFLWKERGTSCTSLPQVHTILRVLRFALQGVAPKAVLLAEANQDLGRLVDYFGAGDEVQIAYHFPLMPALWRAVTTGQAAAIREALTRVPRAVDRAHWWVFSEVHDELTLEIVDEATATEMAGYFLARGAVPFRQSSDREYPRGVSGTTFSLLGGDVRRVLLLWQLKLSLGWTPLFSMGEELGVENDPGYRLDPRRREDSRWVKRVALSEALKRRREEAGTMEAYLYQNLKRWIAWRKGHPCLARPPDFFATGCPSVLGFSKQDQAEGVAVLANCSDAQQTVEIPGLGRRTLRPLEFWWEGRVSDGSGRA